MSDILFHKVLIPVDESEQAMRAVLKAVDLAASGIIGELVLLNVYDNSKVDITKLHNNDKLDELRTESLELLRKYEAVIQEKGVQPRLKRAGGEPSALIMDVIENDGQYDLVIMGSRRLNKFQELAFGSVSDRVCRLVDVPVLVVK